MIRPLMIFVALLGSSADVPGQGIVSAPPQANSISGHVYDQGRNPIADLQVELLNDVDSIIQRTKTDSAGLFAFRRLTSGVFQVRVQTFGTSYIGQTQRVQLERTRAFEQLDFILAIKRTTASTSTPGSVFVQEVPEEARKQFERGASLLQKSDQRQEALKTLQRAVELFPLYFEALELLGTEYVKEREYESAIPVLTKAIEVNGRAYQSMYALSLAQYNLKQLPQALDSMRRAIVFNQKSPAANLWMGMLLRYDQKLDEAEKYLKEADKLAESKLPDAHWQLALLYNDLKRYQEAADELELFLKVQPDSKDKDNIRKLIARFRQKR